MKNGHWGHSQLEFLQIVVLVYVFQSPKITKYKISESKSKTDKMIYSSLSNTSETLSILSRFRFRTVVNFFFFSTGAAVDVLDDDKFSSMTKDPSLSGSSLSMVLSVKVG